VAHRKVADHVAAVFGLGEDVPRDGDVPEDLLEDLVARTRDEGREAV